MFYYTVAVENLPIDGPNAHAREVLEPVIYFMVLASVIAHGITIPLFHIGTFATRTLTSNNENSTQTLRIPKSSRKNIPPTTEIDDNISEAPHFKAKQPEADTKQRHTAITIVTPPEIRNTQQDFKGNEDNSDENICAPRSP